MNKNSPILIRQAKLILSDEVLTADMRIVAGQIAEIGESLSADNCYLVDGKGYYLSAGWIDLQCNGGFGDDFTTSPDTIWAVARKLPRFGVTSFLPTIITSPLTTIAKAQNVWLNGASIEHVGAEPLGLHVEGPYLNPQKKGAHNPQWIRSPNQAEVADWRPDNGIRLVTLAPEQDRALEMVSTLVKNDVVVSAGHSMATFAEAIAGFDKGIRYGTHLFNAMPSLHHRRPGLVGALLDDRRPLVGIIPDGVHIHPALVRMAWQTSGSRLNIVTDAMAAMGLGAGQYTLGDHTVHVDDVRAHLADGTLAGSIITMNAAVYNFWRWTACELTQAIAAVTSVPADLLDLPDRGRIATGYKADLVLFTPEFEVVMTIIGGEIAYDRANISLS